MPRTKFSSPTLELQITEEQHERAVKSASGGCLIADAIREQYPHLSRVTVDMATIQASDRKAGKRYTYLTPPVAQHLLLGFDQGWSQVTDHVVVKRAVKIVPIVRAKTGSTSAAAVAARRVERVAELEAKVARGEELTTGEKKALTHMRNREPAPARPTTRGRPEVSVRREGTTTVHGGTPPVKGQAHPNLLRGRDRHFGAKLADPGLAFTEAVEAAVSERLEQEKAAAPE